jgi:hypothetical protein
MLPSALVSRGIMMVRMAGLRVVDCDIWGNCGLGRLKDKGRISGCATLGVGKGGRVYVRENRSYPNGDHPL